MTSKTLALCLSLTLIVLWHPSSVIASKNTSIDCTVAPYNGTLFASLYETTEETAKTFCQAIMRSTISQNNIDNTHIGSILSDFAVKSEQALDEKKLINSADYKAQFKALKRTLGNFDIKKIMMPEFKVKPSMTSGAEGYFEPLEEAPNRFKINEVEYCRTISSDSNCKAIFEDFASAFNPYRSAYDNVYDNTKLLSELGEQWDNFLYISKSQTILEVWLTTWANYRHFKKDHLVGPPGFQVIAFHPQLVYDSMSNASDGSNQELGLAVEWIGVNFWNLKIPLGLSFTSIYTDRANEKDTGHGALLHIYNHYGVGWARHKDEDSFYITIDLLKMFEEKKVEYDKYAKSYF